MNRYEHIMDFRKNVLYALIPSALMFLASMFFVGDIIGLLVDYYDIAGNIVTLSPQESINVLLSVSVGLSAVLFIPVFAYRLLIYCKELLSERFNKLIKYFVALGVVLSITGFFLGITLMTKIFLKGMESYSLAVNMWSLSSIMFIAVLLGLGLCLSLQLIWIVPLLVNSGVITRNKVKFARPFIIIGGLIISAILTPPDVVSQLVLFSPAYISYETGLFLSKKTMGDETKCLD